MAYRMAPVLVTLNGLEGHFPSHSPFAAFSSAICRTFVHHFARFQRTALHDLLSPKWAWLRSRLKFWANKCYISKTVQHRDILSWKTYRKSYVAQRVAPVLVTLNDLIGHSPVSGLFKYNPSNICAVFYQISTDSALARSPSDSWASCLHQ